MQEKNQKKIKASAESGEVSRIHVGDRKRTVFSGNKVGAYRIRPPDVPFMERITLKIDVFDAFAILGDGVWRAYAIRPYHGTWKMDRTWLLLLKKKLCTGGFAPMPLPSFLVLIQEKKAKENQGLYRGRGS